MAHFYGTIKGRSTTIASRLGTESSGLQVEGSGWDLGGRLQLTSSQTSGDRVQIFLTSGSYYQRETVSFGKFSRRDLLKLLHNPTQLSQLIRDYIDSIGDDLKGS